MTETCLAFTVFRDDFSPKFLALFTLLLFLKSFHWLAEERVDYVRYSLSAKQSEYYKRVKFIFNFGADGKKSSHHLGVSCSSFELVQLTIIA